MVCGPESPLLAQPTPVTALAVAGHERFVRKRRDTPRRHGGNRLFQPVGLEFEPSRSFSLCCNLLVGYASRNPKQKKSTYFYSLPLVVSISFPSHRGGR